MENMKSISKQDAIRELECGNTVYFKKENDNRLYRVNIDQDCDYCNNPRDWENLCHIISYRGDWDISDRGYSLSRDDFRETVESLQKDENVLIKPVYMYDHSGQTISLSPFGDRWDSGICGFICVDKEDVFKWFGENATEENWKELALKDMESEIETYDQYIRGEVYGFSVEASYDEKHERLDTGDIWFTTEWDCDDSCGGYFGDDFTDNGLADEVFHRAVEFFTK